MRKIPSLFCRNFETDRLVRDELVKDARWVVEQPSRATRKYDGTCCLVRDGELWKRYELKQGKLPPFGFEPAVSADPTTGKQQGWLPVTCEPENRWHQEAWDRGVDSYGQPFVDRTYELCGPKIQGNPERQAVHVLIPHGEQLLENVPVDFAGLREYLAVTDVEGIVWHHRDGRMAKIKSRDFGLMRVEFA